MSQSQRFLVTTVRSQIDGHVIDEMQNKDSNGTSATQEESSVPILEYLREPNRYGKKPTREPLNGKKNLLHFPHCASSGADSGPRVLSSKS